MENNEKIEDSAGSYVQADDAINAAITCVSFKDCKKCPCHKTKRCVFMEEGALDWRLAVELKRIIGMRDNAWQELREIREAIKADENESTADEVRSLVHQRDRLVLALEEMVKGGDCV